MAGHKKISLIKVVKQRNCCIISTLHFPKWNHVWVNLKNVLSQWETGCSHLQLIRLWLRVCGPSLLFEISSFSQRRLPALRGKYKLITKGTCKMHIISCYCAETQIYRYPRRAKVVKLPKLPCFLNFTPSWISFVKRRNQWSTVNKK